MFRALTLRQSKRTDRQTDGQTDRQTDRQTEREGALSFYYTNLWSTLGLHHPISHHQNIWFFLFPRANSRHCKRNRCATFRFLSRCHYPKLDAVADTSHLKMRLGLFYYINYGLKYENIEWLGIRSKSLISNNFKGRMTFDILLPWQQCNFNFAKMYVYYVCMCVCVCVCVCVIKLCSCSHLVRNSISGI